MAYLDFIEQVHTGTKRVCLLADNKAEFVTLTKSNKPIGIAQELTEKTESEYPISCLPVRIINPLFSPFPPVKISFP